MDCGDRPVTDAKALVDDLDHRGEAVGGAGRGSDQMVGGGVVEIAIDPIDEVQRAPVLDRGRNDHLLHSSGVVRCHFVCSLENAGAVDDEVDAQFR